MANQPIKAEIDKGIEKLALLRDEVRLQLHLASLDAKREWEEKLAPRAVEVESKAKNIGGAITESTRSTLNELIDKLDDFLARMRSGTGKSDGAH
jgi:hypothetical protein